jgi:hypothetical protein
MSSLGFGTELHYFLGAMIAKGFILLKVDDVSVQCLTDIKSVCNESTLMGNDSVDVTFRFPSADIDLSKIQGEYVIEKLHNNIESKDSNDGNTFPPPPSECDDPLSAYAQFATKFKAIPTIEFLDHATVRPRHLKQAIHKSHSIIEKVGSLGETVLEAVECDSSGEDNNDVFKIMPDTMAKMQNNAVGNIGHFDNELDMEGLAKATKSMNINSQVNHFVFPDGRGIIILAEGRLLHSGCATGHPSFLMSSSAVTSQVLARFFNSLSSLRTVWYIVSIHIAYSLSLFCPFNIYACT